MAKNWYGYGYFTHWILYVLACILTKIIFGGKENGIIWFW